MTQTEGQTHTQGQKDLKWAETEAPTYDPTVTPSVRPSPRRPDEPTSGNPQDVTPEAKRKRRRRRTSGQPSTSPHRSPHDSSPHGPPRGPPQDEPRLSPVARIPASSPKKGGPPSNGGSNPSDPDHGTPGGTSSSSAWNTLKGPVQGVRFCGGQPPQPPGWHYDRSDLAAFRKWKKRDPPVQQPERRA